MNPTAVIDAIKRYDGWLYATGDQAPYMEPPLAPGVRTACVRQPDQPKRTNCVVMTAGVLLAAYPGANWKRESVGELLIVDSRHPWSNIDEASKAGVGVRVDAPIRGAWHLCQGWRSLSADGTGNPTSSGHSWLWLVDVDGTEWMAHASSSAGRVVRERRSWDAQRRRRSDEVRIVKLGVT